MLASFIMRVYWLIGFLHLQLPHQDPAVVVGDSPEGYPQAGCLWLQEGPQEAAMRASTRMHEVQLQPAHPADFRKPIAIPQADVSTKCGLPKAGTLCHMHFKGF